MRRHGLGKKLEEDREKILDGIARWLGQAKTIDILKEVEDRDLWQRMISHANILVFRCEGEIPLSSRQNQGRLRAPKAGGQDFL